MYLRILPDQHVADSRHEPGEPNSGKIAGPEVRAMTGIEMALWPKGALLSVRETKVARVRGKHYNKIPCRGNTTPLGNWILSQCCFGPDGRYFYRGLR